MKALAIVLAAAVAVLAGLAVYQHDSASSAPAVRYMDMQRAASRAAEEVSLNYWNDARPGRRVCSHHVEARKGQRFWCQVVLSGHLVPVEMELLSPLGFFHLVKVGHDEALVKLGQLEHQEMIEEQQAERQLRRHEREEAAAKAARWERQCYATEEGDWLQLCLGEAKEIRNG
jgi:hypothetical protein